MQFKAILSILFLSYSVSIFAQNYGSWTITDNLNFPRQNHASVQLSDGNVLASGGDGEYNTLKSCELYDFRQKKWVIIDSMNHIRAHHKMVLLQDGRVLAVGGKKTTTCEIYDPIMEKWHLTDSLKIMRWYNFTANVLFDGKVIVIGGLSISNDYTESFYLNSCEIYDPETEKWSLIDTLKEGRSSHSSTLLKDGRVLVVGGENKDNELSSCEIFDPIMDCWVSADSLKNARQWHSSVILPDGDVFVSGGVNYKNPLYPWLQSCEIYNPEKNEWLIAGSLASSRDSHNSILINDSTLLIFGGYFNHNNWELYDIRSFNAKYIGNYTTKKQFQTSHLLPDNTVISIGGLSWQDGTPPMLFPTSMCELYDPSMTSVPQQKEIILKNFALKQNYPNPFNPKTVIPVKLYRGTWITVEVYDLLGKKVETLVDEFKPKGDYRFMFYANKLPSGIYFYSVSDKQSKTISKMVKIQ